MEFFGVFSVRPGRVHIVRSSLEQGCVHGRCVMLLSWNMQSEKEGNNFNRNATARKRARKKKKQGSLIPRY